MNDTHCRVYNDMTWQEISAAAQADIPIAVAIGATEQHGPHLPVCTDWFLPERILREASLEHKFIVGPFIPFGYRSRPSSGGGQHFPSTISLRATTLIDLLDDVISELYRSGFRRIALYNWHYENAGFIYEPAFLASQRHPDLKIVVIEDVNPDFTPERIAQLWPDGFPGLALEHAAVIETSLWLHHAGAHVRSDRMVAGQPERQVRHDVVPIDLKMSTPAGSLSSPLSATAEKGKLITEWLIERFVGILQEEFPLAATDADAAAETTPT